MKKTVKTIDENDQVSVIFGISRQIYERSFLQSVYIEIYMSAEKQFHQLFITYHHKNLNSYSQAFFSCKSFLQQFIGKFSLKINKIKIICPAGQSKHPFCVQFQTSVSNSTLLKSGVDYRLITATTLEQFYTLSRIRKFSEKSDIKDFDLFEGQIQSQRQQ